jgi:phasin family protein
MISMNETYEAMLKTTNDGYANLRKLAELNMSTMDKLVAKQMEMMTLCVDASTKQYEGLKNVKDPQELVGKQVEMARECGEKLMSKNREVADLLASTRDDYQAWVEGSVAEIKDKFAAAAPAARKTTRKAA